MHVDSATRIGALLSAPAPASLRGWAGGLSPDHQRWVHPRYPFFLPVRVLSRVFRGRFVAGLKRAYRHGDLCSQDKIFRSFLRALFRQDWVVYAKPPFGGPQHVLHHLARYTHRVAISNHRLVDFTDGESTFRWKDYAHGNKRRLMTVTAEEFLRRFLLHTLPRGFVRIRFFGFLANRRRAASLLLCHQLLETNPRFCRLHQRPLSNPHAAVGPVRFAPARWWSSKGSLLNRSVGSLPGKEPSFARCLASAMWVSIRRTLAPYRSPGTPSRSRCSSGNWHPLQPPHSS